jgi:hypothetical protein
MLHLTPKRHAHMCGIDVPLPEVIDVPLMFSTPDYVKMFSHHMPTHTLGTTGGS